jgi:NADH:ubiquinone oxidoreductase subunit 4 (subunit M)
MIPLIVFMVWIGVHPNTFLKKMEPSVKNLMSSIAPANPAPESPQITMNQQPAASTQSGGAQ